MFRFIADSIVYDLLSLPSDSVFAKWLHFFVMDVVKIFTLVILMVYTISFMRASLRGERFKKFLQGKPKFIAYFLAASFGAITPFCSCSGIPVFVGFVHSSLPVGIAMAFLTTSPLVNEVAVVLFAGLLGAKFTFVYVFLGMSFGMLAGFLFDRFSASKYIIPIKKEKNTCSCKSKACNCENKFSLFDRHNFARNEVSAVLRKIWPWVFVGVAVGGFFHGYLPREWVETNLNAKNWWSVPLAALAGIPLYSNVSGMVPVMEGLISKGVPVGTILAFTMSTVAVSIPSFILLRQVMQFKLLIWFAALLFLLFTITGWIFNFMPFF